MDAKPISIEIYTSSHRVLGRVTPGTTGVFGFANLSTSSSLEIEGATLMRLHQPTRMAGRFNKLWLMKREIAAILVSSRAELGPATMVRAGYTTNRRHWIQMMISGYEIRGIVETPGNFSFDSLMSQETETSFSPLFSGLLTAILFPGINAESAALLFNRDLVDAIALLPKEDIPEEIIE